jgi:hypothetical protein
MEAHIEKLPEMTESDYCLEQYLSVAMRTITVHGGCCSRDIGNNKWSGEIVWHGPYHSACRT